VESSLLGVTLIFGKFDRTCVGPITMNFQDPGESQGQESLVGRPVKSSTHSLNHGWFDE
jgi:hypothetical protein